MQLAVSLETDRVVFFVDCQEVVVLPIKSDERINLELPEDTVVALASTPGKKDSRFSVSFLHSAVLTQIRETPPSLIYTLLTRPILGHN